MEYVKIDRELEKNYDKLNCIKRNKAEIIRKLKVLESSSNLRKHVEHQ